MYPLAPITHQALKATTPNSYSEKASLRIAPVFRMTPNTVYPDTPIAGHYFNAGIEFGAVYHL